jgi:hypothetical protein
VNSLLIESDIYDNENFIMSKSRGNKQESVREERKVGATSMEDTTT